MRPLFYNAGRVRTLSENKPTKMQDETKDNKKSFPGRVSVLRRTLREQKRTEGILVGKLVPGIKSKIVDLTWLRSVTERSG